MRSYYLIRVIYKRKSIFLIWYSDNEDGFLVSEQGLLMFTGIGEAKSFAKKREILLESEVTVYDFSNVIELIKGIDCSENCHILINIWNFFSDLAKSINERFIGDFDDGLTIDIYNKLFYGINLKALKKDDKEYHPVFNEEEIQRCISIYDNGLSILDRQFDQT